MRTYNNEEEIKVHLVLPWLESLGYKREFMAFEKTIKINEGRKTKSIFADIVVYTDKKLETPLIVVDTKSPSEILSKEGRDQVISYARLLPKIAPIAVLTNGNNIQVYQTLDKSRIKELPKRKEILADFVSAVLSKNIQEVLRQEATKELFTIDDVSTFKDLLKKCHNIIRNNEGYDPIQAFDELSKILFAKMYEEQYNKSSNRFTSEIYEKTLKELNVNIVQQQFSEIQKVKGFRDLFPENTTIKLKDRTIKDIVAIFESYDLTLTNFDVKGEAFEYFLGDTFTGGLGEYFTPRNVVEFLVEAISPKIGEKIVDPFCGTGGFLIYAFEKVSEKIRLNDFSDEEKSKWKKVLSDESLFGTDWKARTSQACKMNMIVHGDGNTGVFQHDGFINVEGKIFEEKFDICFTNPPFGANETDKAILDSFSLGDGRSSQSREILAIERCLNLVKKGTGIVAFILPDGILNGDRNAYVREYIQKEANVLAVIGLNKETFQGYSASVKTSAVILKRKLVPNHEISDEIFMAVCTNTGYAPTGLQITGNQLPDILFDFRNSLKDKNHEHIFKYSKIVKIDSLSARLDAERYIPVNEDSTIELPNIVSENLLNEINILGKQIVNIQMSMQKVFDRSAFDFIKAEKIFSPIKNIISIKSDEEYERLGVSGKGNGVFKKEPASGSIIKAKRLNQVKAGWFVYSRLFAHNGSFAYTTNENAGGVFSGEFPTFTLKFDRYEKDDLLEYLAFYFVSPQVIALINRLTTGSTKESRARFKEEQFLKLYAPIPKTEDVFLEIVSSIRQINQFKKDIRKLHDRLDELPISYRSTLPFKE
ncbi:MAG: N-6 DNA methylase [Bacteroidales bacterium]|nr:N-6 DNA methylase [Bacteroidales bacterium]